MIERRLREAAEEIRNYSQYDYVLVNREVEASVETLVSIVKATRSRRDRMEEQIRPILTLLETLKMPETNFKTDRAERDSGRSGSERYRFIIVAAKRARQLQNGARSFLPTTSKKPTVAAMEEVRRGLVQYDDPAFASRRRSTRRRVSRR